MQARSLAPLLRAALTDRTVRFLITGGGAAVLFYALTFGFVRAGAPPFTGTLAAYAVAFVASYTVQRAWTFSGQHDHRHALPRYLAAQIGAALVASAVSRAAAHAGVAPASMALASTLVGSACGFVLSRYWVFADRR